MFLSEKVARRSQTNVPIKFTEVRTEVKFNLRLTHEGVAGGKTLVRSPIVVGFSLLHGWSAVTLLVGGSVMETGVGELHQDSGGAEVKMLGQEVVPPFRAGQAAAVGVNADGPLVDGTA